MPTKREKENYYSGVELNAEMDLGMFSMFGRTGAPTKRGPRKSTKIIFATW